MSDRLWAPWRMEYILGPKDGPCIFCEFAAAPPALYREKLVLVVQAHALVCLNRYPFAACHLLVAPRRHVSDVGDLPAEENDAMIRLLREAVSRLMLATNPEAVHLGLHLGTAAAATTPSHLHPHTPPPQPPP